MLKNNLKINDTFLVTVEILTSDAIIVSANINSVIFRGTLIRCNKNSNSLFKKVSDSQTSFSSSRLDLKNFKRQFRFKTFKSSYNLRTTSKKIIKAKKKINKSELKNVKNAFKKKSLSIKLKKDNGVYVNTSISDENSNLSPIKKSINSSITNDISAKNKTNVIKIVKTKLNSNKYQYSIINKLNQDESNNLLNENNSQSKILKLCLTPIPENLLIQTASLSEQTSPQEISNLIFDISSNTTEKNLEFCQPEMDFVSLKEESQIKLEPKLGIIDDVLETSDLSRNTLKLSPVNLPEKLKPEFNKSHNVTKLKIVKNGSKPNSYIIKSPEKTANNIISKSTHYHLHSHNGNINKNETVHKRYNCKKFCIGDIVWAKLSGYSIWPAKVIDLNQENDNATVMWLGDDYRTSQLAKWKLWDFRAHFHEKFNKKGKGNYMNAVQQAQTEYSKLDFTENSSWIFDISSESSTLESVNIDDTSCELDQISLQESSSTIATARQNVYLPLPDEEFELMRSCSKSGISDFLSFDSSPGSQQHTPHSSQSHFSAKIQLNPNNIDYNFI